MRTLVNVGRLLHLRVVRAGEQADVDVGPEVRAVELGVDHRLAELGHAHDVPPAFALQLDDVGVGDGGADRRRRPARDLPVLQRGEAVAVHRRVHVRRVGLEALADDHADLAVRIGARADELHVGADEEVAAHLPPRELELVARGPHVGAAGGQRVGLGGGVVGGGSRDGRRAEVRRRFEVADGRSDGRRRRRCSTGAAGGAVRRAPGSVRERPADGRARRRARAPARHVARVGGSLRLRLLRLGPERGPVDDVIRSPAPCPCCGRCAAPSRRRRSAIRSAPASTRR